MNPCPLLLYGTTGCHLCEQAEQLLLPLVESGRFQVELVDISEDPQLMERYGLLIPVLGGRDRQGTWRELRWPFDQAQVWNWSGQLSLMCQGS